MPSRPNAMATFDVREHLFWTNTKIMVRESAARTESSALWSELEWNVRCTKLLPRTTSDVMDLHMWLSKNGTNKGLLTQTLTAHSQLVPTISSAWVRATLPAGSPFWGCLAFLNHRWGGSGQRRHVLAPSSSIHLSVQRESHGVSAPSQVPRREAGHMAVSLWPLPAPCYLGELSWAAGLSRLVHCSSWSWSPNTQYLWSGWVKIHTPHTEKILGKTQGRGGQCQVGPGGGDRVTLGPPLLLCKLCFMRTLAHWMESRA